MFGKVFFVFGLELRDFRFDFVEIFFYPNAKFLGFTRRFKNENRGALHRVVQPALSRLVDTPVFAAWPYLVAALALVLLACLGFGLLVITLVATALQAVGQVHCSPNTVPFAFWGSDANRMFPPDLPAKVLETKN